MSLSEALEAAMPEFRGEEPAATATPEPSSTPETGLDLSAFGVETKAEPKAEGEDPPSESKWEVTLPPDTVVATVDGKPITAAEVEKSFMLQSDYTRKTQEVAEQRREMAQIAEAWETQVLPVMQGLQSEDPQTRKDTLLSLAQSYGIDLGPQRSRGADGRFAQSEKPDDGMIDLSQFEEGSEAWILAQTANRQTEQLRTMQQHWERQQAESQTSQTRAEMEAMASSWKATGMDADIGAAQALVGKTITPEQAMKLSHWEAVLGHVASKSYELATKPKPDEPVGGTKVNGTREDLAGISLSKALGLRGA